MENRRLIDLDKIKPIDFPSTEMDGLDVVRYLNTLPNDNANNYVAFHEYNKAEHFCSYGERRNDG